MQSTGAYNYAMASNYNRFTKPACVFVRDGQADLVSRRETLDDVVRLDVIPERLANRNGSAVISLAGFRHGDLDHRDHDP